MNNSDSDYELAEIETVSPEQRRRTARRWMLGILTVQAVVLLIGLAAVSDAAWVSLSENSLWRAIPVVISGPLLTAASVIWPTSVVVAPLLIAFACIAAVESRSRTLAMIAVSVLLTGLPWLFVSQAFWSRSG